MGKDKNAWGSWLGSVVSFRHAYYPHSMWIKCMPQKITNDSHIRHFTQSSRMFRLCIVKHVHSGCPMLLILSVCHICLQIPLASWRQRPWEEQGHSPQAQGLSQAEAQDKNCWSTHPYHGLIRGLKVSMGYKTLLQLHFPPSGQFFWTTFWA